MTMLHDQVTNHETWKDFLNSKLSPLEVEVHCIIRGTLTSIMSGRNVDISFGNTFRGIKC